MGTIRHFIDSHYLHFNAASLREAAAGYKRHVERGGKMMITLGGAMSTAELGRSLAEMIREDKVHAICCTGANLEEDIFNLVAHHHYKRISHYRDLTAEDEVALLAQGYNRVTDTCIPEQEAMRQVEGHLLRLWQEAEQAGRSKLPHFYLYELLERGLLKESYQADPRDSWVLAASERKLPLFVPGWEDSTLGNVFAAHCLKGELRPERVLSGTYYMTALASWYQAESKQAPLGFFQIGGGISGDFPICVVPMLTQDMQIKDTPLWAYFCQISEARPSYGSYSGAPPNEKITWGKLGVETPRFVIESDATIVVPLIFAYLLGW